MADGPVPGRSGGDWRRLLLACAPAGLLGAALGMGKVVRDCSLTCNVGYELAPLGILAVAALTVPFSVWRLRLEARWGYRRWHLACALLAASSLAGFRLLTWVLLEGRRGAEGQGALAVGWIVALQWTYLAYFVWLGALAVLLGANAIEHAYLLYPPAQRRRPLYSVALAAAAGALAGAWVSGRLAGVLLAAGWRYEIVRDNLLLLMAVLVLAELPLVWRVDRRVSAPGPAQERGDTPTGLPSGLRLGTALGWLRAEGRWRRLASLALVAGVADTLGKYLFYWLVSEQYQPSNGRTMYFADFHTWLGGITLLMLAFGTPRLIGRAGTVLALATLPVALAAGTVALLAQTLLVVMYAVRVAEGAVRESLYGPALERLFLAGEEARSRLVRPLLGGLLPRVGEGLGAVAVLLLNFGLGVSLRAMLVLYLIVLLAWLACVVRLRGDAPRDATLRLGDAAA